MTTNIQTFSGNVGIGTNDPGSFKLNVNGSVSATSLTVGGITNSEVPSGLIAMWSGALDDLPTGWKICDGTNSTPDLANKFILGSEQDGGGDPTVGQSGGAHDKTLLEANLPAHDHSVSVSQAGQHAHPNTGQSGHHCHGVSTEYGYRRMGTYGANQNSIGNFNGYRLDIAYAPLRRSQPGSNMYADCGGQHAHSVPQGGQHAHPATESQVGSGTSFDVKPAYYVLAFIMKI
jgi:microcystin-dependent protein